MRAVDVCEIAERVAHLLEDAQRAVKDDGRPAGALVIGSLESTAALRLSPILAQFASAHQDVDLQTVEVRRHPSLASYFHCGQHGAVNQPEEMVFA
jgi:DNA-binding transcriptional LysR family regulator